MSFWWPQSVSLPWRPRSLRTRLLVASALLLGLVVLNVGAFLGSARERDDAFVALRAAIARHSALTEAKAALDDEYKRVRVVSDLIGVDDADLNEAERAAIVAAIESARASLDDAVGDTEDPALDALVSRADSLSASWLAFYDNLNRNPTAALTEVVLRAEPLARDLLSNSLPAAIRTHNARVEFASAAFEEADRLSWRMMWLILLASVLISGLMVYSLSRDVLASIAALKMGADRFGAAELDYRVRADNFDELADVANSLNTMAGRLRTAHQELEVRNEELALLAFRDPLTRLANRSLFREQVERKLADPDTRPEDIAVLYVDVDNFKTVNDTHGHNTGDRLLVEVAARMLHATRGCDTVARLGGDEFGILLDVRQGDEAVIVAERVIATLRKPFTIDGRVMHAGASVGLAWGRTGETADELLRDADVAMYTAKSKGKGRYEVFSPAMHAALIERIELESDLRTAVAKGEFVLEYQPIVELSTRAVTGYEALVRWNHPTRGRILPGNFVQIAEESGDIVMLGRWVFERACGDAARWQQALPDTPLTIHVNVSSHQLDHPGIVGDLMELIESCGLDPERLVIEVTESVIMRDSQLMLSRLRELKSLGIRLAIDDFGTGYSSLAYLQRFPVDIIKIDKAFVKSVAIRSSDAALARTIIMLSETLGLHTVAEGIEYHDQHVMLQELGCQLGQGYRFAAPMDIAAILASLASPDLLATGLPPTPAPRPLITASELDLSELTRADLIQ